MTDKINILGKNVRIEYAQPSHQRLSDVHTDLREMENLINRTVWPEEYSSAYRLLNRIYFFYDSVTVNTHVMSRSCCDEDDAVFYWELDEEFLKNRDADVHASTLFHDCWHIVQFQRDGGFATHKHVQLAREVEATNHQIKVAKLLGCSHAEISHLVKFRDDTSAIAARLAYGVHTRKPTSFKLTKRTVTAARQPHSEHREAQEG